MNIQLFSCKKAIIGYMVRNEKTKVIDKMILNSAFGCLSSKIVVVFYCLPNFIINFLITITPLDSLSF